MAEKHNGSETGLAWRELFVEAHEQDFAVLQGILESSREKVIGEMREILVWIERGGQELSAEARQNGIVLLLLLAKELLAREVWEDILALFRSDLLLSTMSAAGHKGLRKVGFAAWSWEVIYRLGNGVAAFEQGAADAGYPDVVREAAVTAVGQWAWHRPVERTKVIAALERLIQSEIKRAPATGGENDWRRMLIRVPLDLRAHPLTPQLHTLCEVSPPLTEEFPSIYITREIHKPLHQLSKSHFADLATWFNRIFPREQSQTEAQTIDRTKRTSPTHLRRNQEPYQRTRKKVGRNDPCPCGSGKKYKKCCLKKR